MNSKAASMWGPMQMLALVALSLGSVVANAGDEGRTIGGAQADALQSVVGMTFAAAGPHSSLGAPAKLMGRFVGTWDVAYTDFAPDGKATRHAGELVVGWVMDGRAIADLWIVDPTGARNEREIYTGLRYFNAKTGTWAGAFIDAEHATVTKFSGVAANDDEMVLITDGHKPEEVSRWTFNDVRPDRFVLRTEISSDGGKTWRLEGEDHMTRRTSPALTR